MNIEREIFHAHARKPFHWIIPVLEAWGTRVLHYSKNWSRRQDASRDAAYWYGERASNSVLAAAIADKGAQIICEYNCERVPSDALAGRRTGRTDLWFQLGRRQAVVEAKQRWPSHTAALPKTGNAALHDAARQLRASAHEAPPQAHLLSVVFLVPRIASSETTDEPPGHAFVRAADIMLDARRSDDEAFVTASAWAWCFPVQARNLRGISAPKHVFPGVIMLLREESRAAAGGLL